MPKIQPYDKLDPLLELGTTAELFVDQNCYDVARMNVNEMLVIYEPEILNAERVTLVSEDVGNWKYNHDRSKWERM